MAIPTQRDQGSVMVAKSDQRITELGKLLKGKIRSDWALLDEPIGNHLII